MWDASNKHRSPSNIHLVSITLPSASQGRRYRSHVTVKNLLEQWGNNLPRALEGSLPDSGVDSVIPTPDVFPGHHTHKQNEDFLHQKRPKHQSLKEPSFFMTQGAGRSWRAPAFYITNRELIWAGLWVGRKAEAGPKEILEAFLEKMRKEKAGGVALTLTDPGEDSRNREPRESPGNDSQLCLALLRKWFPLGATN